MIGWIFALRTRAPTGFRKQAYIFGGTGIGRNASLRETKDTIKILKHTGARLMQNTNDGVAFVGKIAQSGKVSEDQRQDNSGGVETTEKR